MFSLKWSSLAVILLLAMEVISLGAASSSLRGRVTDTNGAIITGAEVTVTNSSTNSVRKVVTDSGGLYHVPELSPGTYTIEVSRAGFQRVTRRQVVLNVAGVYTEDFALTVGTISEQVVVEGNSSLVNRDSSTVATVIDRQFIANLPLNGRSFQVLMELTVFGRFNLSPSEQFFRSFPSQENQFRKDTRTFTGGVTWTITPRVRGVTAGCRRRR